MSGESDSLQRKMYAAALAASEFANLPPYVRVDIASDFARRVCAVHNMTPAEQLLADEEARIRL